MENIQAQRFNKAARSQLQIVLVPKIVLVQMLDPPLIEIFYVSYTRFSIAGSKQKSKTPSK